MIWLAQVIIGLIVLLILTGLACVFVALVLRLLCSIIELQSMR